MPSIFKNQNSKETKHLIWKMRDGVLVKFSWCELRTVFLMLLHPSIQDQG
jgi:hypothetical protein